MSLVNADDGARSEIARVQITVRGKRQPGGRTKARRRRGHFQASVTIEDANRGAAVVRDVEVPIRTELQRSGSTVGMRVVAQQGKAAEKGSCRTVVI